MYQFRTDITKIGTHGKTQNAVMAEEPVIVLHFAGVVPLED